MSDEFTIECSMQYYDLERLLNAVYGEDYTDFIETVACYLTEYVDYQIDLTTYMWNAMLFNVHVFDTREECDNWIKDNVSNGYENDCTIYECSNGKFYLELP